MSRNMGQPGASLFASWFSIHIHRFLVNGPRLPLLTSQYLITLESGRLPSAREVACLAFVQQQEVQGVMNDISVPILCC